MFFFSGSASFGTKPLFRYVAVILLLAGFPLMHAPADIHKFYGNGAAGTVIEVSKESIADCADSALAEKALSCIIRSITTFSNIQVADRRIIPASDDEDGLRGGGKKNSLSCRLNRHQMQTAGACTTLSAA